MNTLIAQINLESKLFLRDKRSLFMTFAFPVIMVFIFGWAFGNQTWSGLPAINYLLPGIIVMALMMVALNNNAVKISGDREKGIYRRLSLTPLKKQTLLMGHIFIRYFIIIVSTLLLIVIGAIFFKTHIVGNALLFLLVLPRSFLRIKLLGDITLHSFGVKTKSTILSTRIFSASRLFPVPWQRFFPIDVFLYWELGKMGRMSWTPVTRPILASWPYTLSTSGAACFLRQLKAPGRVGHRHTGDALPLRSLSPHSA